MPVAPNKDIGGAFSRAGPHRRRFVRTRHYIVHLRSCFTAFASFLGLLREPRA